MSFVGYLQYTHPYLTNQHEALKDLKKVSGCNDLTLEHHPIQIGSYKIGFKKGIKTQTNSRTLAWNIGAPSDTAAEIQKFLFENWTKI